MAEPAAVSPWLADLGREAPLNLGGVTPSPGGLG